MKEKNEHREIRDELRQIAPGLSELKREDGFTTPHNYFKEFPDKVLVKIATEEQKPASVLTWLQSLMRPRFVVAFASVLVLIVAGVWYSRMQSTSDPIVSITQDEALEYVLDNLYDFTSDDLISSGVLTEWDATEISPASKEEYDQIIDEIIQQGNGEIIEELF